MRSRAAVALMILNLLGTTAVIAGEIVIPAGTPLHFKLRHSISTATAKAGQSVPAELTSPVVVNGTQVARAGSAAVVHISDVESSGRIGGSASLRFSLSSITLSNGSAANVHTSSYSRQGKAHAKHNATVITGERSSARLPGRPSATTATQQRKGQRSARVPASEPLQRPASSTSRSAPANVSG